MSVWRIAADTKDYSADDLTGKGAEKTGGRWNREGTPVLYTANSRALAALETFVHLNAGGLPLNRYLIEIVLPDDIWNAAQVETTLTLKVGWDAEPASATSTDFGTRWLAGLNSLLLVVPSVIIPEERNVLINPRHGDIGRVQVKKVRKWLFDPRLIKT